MSRDPDDAMAAELLTFLARIQANPAAAAASGSCCVCLLAEVPTELTGNLTGPCHDCGRLVQFRPYTPAVLPKICLRCALERTQGGTA